MSHLPPITPDAARQVADYLLVERTALKKADICLVFSSKHIYEELAETVAQLYQQGYFPRIIATGGTRLADGRKEAEAVRDALEQRGVPREIIYLEMLSENCQQNVERARQFLNDAGLLPQIRSVIGVGHICTGRRFIMTLARNWPEVLPMHVSANTYAGPVADWAKNPEFVRRTLLELSKIGPYMEADFIKEVDLDRLNEAVRAGDSLQTTWPPVFTPSFYI